MPRDPAGNYSLPPSYFAQAGTTIRTEQHNPPLEDIASALSGSLVRDGRNGMVGPLDMGTFPIRNVADGALPSDGANVSQTVPIGTVLDYAGSTAPTGWLFCAGQSLSRSEYASLFAVIGTTYGAPDGLTFRVPDARGRARAGRDDMGGTDAGRLSVIYFALARTLGAGFGLAAHTLGLSEIPAHDHGGVTTANGGHNHGGSTSSAGDHTHAASASSAGAHNHAVSAAVINGTGNGGLPTGGNLGITLAPTTIAGDHTHTITVFNSGAHAHAIETTSIGNHVHGIASQGSGGPHNNTQPTLILNTIIKASY